MSAFVRTYENDGVVFTCALVCDIRGGGIREVNDLDVDSIDCPRCLLELKERLR